MPFMNRTISLCVSAGLLALWPACTSASEHGRAAGPHLDQSEPRDATASGDAVVTPTGLEDLTLPADGFQVRSAGADIGPGEDVEYCEIGELPGDPGETYYVGSVELANAVHSHHLVVATALPGTPADVALRAMNLGDKVVCNGTNYEWPQEGLVFVG